MQPVAWPKLANGERERRLERETGIEPATNSLEGCDSTTELLPPSCSPLPLARTSAGKPPSHSAFASAGSRRACPANRPASLTPHWLASRSLRASHLPTLSAAWRRLVARGGFEPPKPLGRQIYSLLRLTAPQPRRVCSCAAAAATRPPAHAACRETLGCKWNFDVYGATCRLPRAQAGAGGGIRTPDRLITNQLLYRTELRQPDKDGSLARPVPDCQPLCTRPSPAPVPPGRGRTTHFTHFGPFLQTRGREGACSTHSALHALPGTAERGSPGPPYVGPPAAAVLCGVAVYGNLDFRQPIRLRRLRTIVDNGALARFPHLHAVVMHDSTRPVASISFAIDRAIWGTSPFGFHVTSLFLHRVQTWCSCWSSRGAPRSMLARTAQSARPIAGDGRSREHVVRRASGAHAGGGGPPARATLRDGLSGLRCSCSRAARPMHSVISTRRSRRSRRCRAAGIDCEVVTQPAVVGEMGTPSCAPIHAPTTPRTRVVPAHIRTSHKEIGDHLSFRMFRASSCKLLDSL